MVKKPKEEFQRQLCKFKKSRWKKSFLRKIKSFAHVEHLIVARYCSSVPCDLSVPSLCQHWDGFLLINHPQLGETNPPQQMDTVGEDLFYDGFINLYFGLDQPRVRKLKLTRVTLLLNRHGLLPNLRMFSNSTKFVLLCSKRHNEQSGVFRDAILKAYSKFVHTWCNSRR